MPRRSKSLLHRLGNPENVRVEPRPLAHPARTQSKSAGPTRGTELPETDSRCNRPPTHGIGYGVGSGYIEPPTSPYSDGELVKEASMKRIIFLMIILSLCSFALVGQQAPPSAKDNQTAASDQNTIQGCLSRNDAGYILTDTSGVSYQLSGSTQQLSDHVGHEIQVTGSVMKANPASSSSAAASGMATIDVSKFKHVAASCSSPNKPGDSPSTQPYPK